MKGLKIAVIGVGKYGSATARHLASKGAEVYCFDNNIDKIESIKDEVALAVALDATDIKALVSQNIQEMNAAIVAIGDNFEAVILATVNLMELEVKHVTARASGNNQKMILEKLGVVNILTPEEEVANVLSERLLNPNILSFMELPDDYEVAEIRAPKKSWDRTIREIDFRNRYKLTLITIKRESKGHGDYVECHTLGVPEYDTVIKETDTLMVFGTRNHVERYLEVNS